MKFFQKIKKYKPKDATIAVTYACNSRCKMCNIWQIKNPQALKATDFYNLSPDLKYINLSGGEPFLHPDLPEIVRMIKKRNSKVQIIISSNGYATDLIVNTMKEILAIDHSVGLRISIDGLKKTHNRIRGIENIYEHAMETIQRLKEIGVSNLGLSFTIMNENADELIDVYKLAEENSLQMALALVQNSDIYFSKRDNKITFLDKIETALNYVIFSEIKSWSPKRWGRAFYDYGLLHYAKFGRRILPSGAGFDSLFIDPSGNIYPSNLINLKMGNIKKDSLDNVWSSKAALAIRQKIKDENITESWIICTIRGEMKKHLFKMGAWAFWRKTRLLFRV